MRKIVFPLVVLAAVVALSGGAATTEAEARETGGYTLRIGDVVPFTGASAVFGPAYAKAAGLAVQEAKKALRRAGVRDINIQIEHADDATTPEGGVNAARKLIANGADCILGALTSASSIAISQAATTPARIPHIAPNNSSPALTDLRDNGYFFRVMPSDVLQAPVLARVIQQEMARGSTISLAGRNDAFGTGLLPRLKTNLERLGLRTQGPLLYDPTAASYNSEAGDIVRGNPDAYVILDFPANYARIAAALLRTGRFNGNKLFVAGGWPATIPSFIPEASLEGARGTSAGSPLGTRAANAFHRLYTTSPGLKERQTLELNNFDGAMMCILASVAAKSSRGSEIVKHVRRVSSPPGRTYTYLGLTQAIRDLRAGRDINYEGVGGGADLDANGDLQTAIYNVFTYKDGKQSVIRQLRIRK